MASADPIATFPYLEEGHQRDSSAWWEDTRQKDIRRAFLPMRTVRQWSCLPREALQSLSLEVFKVGCAT